MQFCESLKKPCATGPCTRTKAQLAQNSIEIRGVSPARIAPANKNNASDPCSRSALMVK